MNHFDMELTQRQAQAYRKAAKKQKGEIISRYCELTGVSRNLAGKRFRKALSQLRPRILEGRGVGKKRGRKPTYMNLHSVLVRQAWELSGEICGERLHPILGLYLTQLAAHGRLRPYDPRVVEETKQMSERTLKRVIATFPKTSSGRKSQGNAAIYKAIPIQAHFGKNSGKAGYVEIDYVEHNGGNASGIYANTGSYIDVGLGWIARAAALGKGMAAVSRIHDLNKAKIHHRIHEYHPDNARPILKLLLEKTLGEKPAGYSLSRSRPYHKEDNGHVEQKNGDKVRKLVGYHRYDTEKQVDLLNRLYRAEDLISNFFLPSQKLMERVKDEKGRIVRRRYDQAKTAYQRLLEAEDVDKRVKRQVRTVYNRLDLIELRQQSDKLQSRLLQTVISRKYILA